MYREELSMIQITFLMGSFFFASAGLFYTNFAFQAAEFNHFAVVLAGGAIALALGWLVTSLCKNHPRQNMVEMAYGLTGPYLAPFLFLPLILIHFLVPLPVFRFMGELITDMHLQNTSPALIVYVMLAISCWFALLGTECATRTNDEHLIIIFPLTAFMFIVSIPDLRPELVLPIHQVDWKFVTKPEFYGSLVAFFGFSITLFLNDAVSQSRGLRAIVTGVTIFGTLYLLGIVFIVVGTLGINLATTFDMPLKVKMTTLKPFIFVSRVDVILVLIWIFPTTTSMAILINTAARAMGGWLRMKNYRSVVWAYFFIAFILVREFETYRVTSMFMLNLSLAWVLAIFIGAGTLLLLSLLRKKNKRASDKNLRKGESCL